MRPREEKPSRRSFVAVGLSTLIACSSGCRRRGAGSTSDDTGESTSGDTTSGAASGVSTNSSKAWSSDPALAAQLDPPTAALGYVVRPPRLFVETKWSEDEAFGIKSPTWLLHDNPTERQTFSGGAKFWLFAYAAPSNGGLPRTPDEHIDRFFSMYRKIFGGTASLDPDTRTTNGIAFRRAFYSAKKGYTGVVEGYLQAGVDNGKVVGICCVGDLPDIGQYCRLASEAGLTLRRYENGPVRLFQTSARGRFDNKLIPLREKMIGIGQLPSYRDIGPKGGILVGFDVGLDKDKSIQTLQPIYRVDGKDVSGQLRGDKKIPLVRQVAKVGYAVGAIEGIGLMHLSGFSIRYMKVVGNQLNPADSYPGSWIGDHPNLPAPEFLGDGTPLVGIRCQEAGLPDSMRFAALGLVYREEEV